MKTITIEDPVEANAAMKSAFPEALSTWASCGADKGKIEWTAYVCHYDDRPDCSARAETFAEAFDAVKAEAASFEPLAILRKKAEELGLVLVKPA